MESSKQAKTFYVRDILSIVWKRKWLVVIPAILVTGITIAGSFYIAPVYEANVTIFMDKPVRLSQDIQRLVGGLNQIGNNPETMSRELQSLQNEIVSSPYMAQLIEKMQLDKDPWVEVTARKLQVEQPNMSLNDLKFDLLLNSLRNRINVEFAGINQVRIIVQSSSPEQAKSIAQNLGDIFIQEKTKQESRTISASSEFSSDQIETYDRDLQSKIDAKTALEKQLVQIQIDEVVASDENRRQINLEIQGVTLEISEKQRDEREATGRLASMSGGIPTLASDKDMADRQAELATLLGSMTDLMRKYSWNAPSLVSFKIKLYGLASDLDERIAQLVRRQFAQQSESVKNDLISMFSAQKRLEVLNKYSDNLKSAVSDLNRRASAMPEYNAQITQLDREIQALQSVRDQFKLSQQGTQISQALLTESKYRVIEPARVPISPVWPNKRMIMLLGLFVGLSLGGGAVVIAEFFDNSFKKIEDAERALGFNVIGTMPKIEGLERLKVSPGR